jgi:hypothetical protein
MEAGQFHQREYRRSFAPNLHIEDRSLFDSVAYLELPPELKARFKDDGYLQGNVDWGLDVKLMADTVRALSAANLSPIFAYIYDEFWYPFFKLHLLFGALLGGRYSPHAAESRVSSSPSPTKFIIARGHECPYVVKDKRGKVGTNLRF